MNLGIQFFGPVWDISGIANALRNTAIALYDAGVPVNIIEMQNWSGLYANLDKPTKAKLDAILRNPIPLESIYVNYVPPNKITHMRNDSVSNVAYTLFETDNIPAVWPMILEKEQMDEVWVPTEFNKATFIKGGINPNDIHVMPMGVDLKQYHTGVEPIKIKNSRRFKFLTIMDVKECKGFDILLDAYFQEFSANDDVSLIFKGYSGNLEKASQDRIAGMIKMYKEKNKSTAEVIFVGGNVADHLIPGLQKAADCYVLPTKGEGWSLGTLQSMAVGVPALMTRCSGYLDYMNDTNGMFLEGEWKPIRNIGWLIREPYQQGHNWFETTVEETKRKMRWAYEHPTELKVLGAKAAIDAKAWGWENAAKKIIDRMLVIGNNQ